MIQESRGVIPRTAYVSGGVSVTVCQGCGAELLVGEWPFCPHGRTGNYTAAHDEIPGGIVVENYGPHPIRFYSHSERRAYMRKHGLQERETFAPIPGTDKDPAGIPNPAGYIDEYTMRGKIELLLRAQGASGKQIQADMDHSRVVTGTVPDGAQLSDVLELVK